MCSSDLVAPENEGQRHEGKENQAAQSGKKEKLLIAVRANELQIERGLQHQDGEQQKSADRQRDHRLPAAGGLGFVANWIRCGQGLITL